MSRIIAGFDVSSTTYGWGILQIDDENNIKYIDSGYFKPDKESSLIERLALTRDIVNSILTKYNPDYIGIENIVEFMKGHSTAKTIVLQASYNRMTALAAYDFLRSINSPNIPELFSVMSIRHGLKLNKIFPSKEEMPDLVAHHLGIIFPWESKKIRGKTEPQPIVENYDKSDALAVGLYYAYILTGRLMLPKIKSKNKKKSQKRKL